MMYSTARIKRTCIAIEVLLKEGKPASQICDSVAMMYKDGSKDNELIYLYDMLGYVGDEYRSNKELWDEIHSRMDAYSTKTVERISKMNLDDSNSKTI
jgi:hypothetical protein